jgi:hypothetical protein
MCRGWVLRRSRVKAIRPDPDCRVQQREGWWKISCWLAVASWKRVYKLYLVIKISNDNWCDGRYSARVMHEEKDSRFPQLGQRDDIFVDSQGGGPWDARAILLRFTVRQKRCQNQAQASPIYRASRPCNARSRENKPVSLEDTSKIDQTGLRYTRTVGRSSNKTPCFGTHTVLDASSCLHRLL